MTTDPLTGLDALAAAIAEDGFRRRAEIVASMADRASRETGANRHDALTSAISMIEWAEELLARDGHRRAMESIDARREDS